MQGRNEAQGISWKLWEPAVPEFLSCNPHFATRNDFMKSYEDLEIFTASYDLAIKSISDKKYRKLAHVRFMVPVEQNLYQDANKILLGFEKRLRAINDSAADSRDPGGDPRDRWLNVSLVLSIRNKPQPNSI